MVSCRVVLRMVAFECPSVLSRGQASSTSGPLFMRPRSTKKFQFFFYLLAASDSILSILAQLRCDVLYIQSKWRAILTTQSSERERQYRPKSNQNGCFPPAKMLHLSHHQQSSHHQTLPLKARRTARSKKRNWQKNFSRDMLLGSHQNRPAPFN